MVTQIVSREQVEKMRADNLAEINNMKAQIYQMEIQSASTANQSRALKSASVQSRRKMKTLLTRASKLDKLLRTGKVATNGQTFVVQ